MTRPGRRRDRVRVRVTAAATLVGILGGLLGAVLFVGGLNENLEESLSSSAKQEVDTIDAQLRAGGDPQQVSVSSKRDVIIQILDADGTILATDHPGVAEPIRTTPGSSRDVRVETLVDRYTVRSQRSTDGLLVVVGLSDEQVRRATKIAVVLLAIAVPLGIALLAAVVWLALGRALRSVEVMRQEAATITSEHLHRRLAVPPGDDEIPLLAETLNEMLDRIDQSQRQQRQFVSDASHELRSPLATLRQLAEVARRYPDRTDLVGFADDVLAEEHRMEDLVKALLVLARLDDGHSVRAEPVDLDDIVLDAAARLRSVRSDLAVDLGRVSGGQVHGDPVLVSQVVTNLLSNAARHARSTVRVRVEETGSQVRLVVEDDGNGIDVADRERVFARFARLDEARARDAGGAGLGLAIVADVVAVLGGSVEVDDADLGGARFTVTLPVQAG